MSDKPLLYRTETAYGSGERDVIKVLTHELYELNNKDTLCYLMNNYIEKYKLSTIEMVSYDYIKSKYFIIMNADGPISTAIQDKVFIEKMFEYIIEMISKRVGFEIKYCLWLAELEYVQEYYNDNSLDEIDAYEISDVILSDIGNQGKLFGYAEIPKIKARLFDDVEECYE